MTSCDRPVTAPTTIHAVAGHMHLLGRSIRVELNPGTPRERLLLEIPQWSFHWQASYVLERPVRAAAGRRPSGHLQARPNAPHGRAALRAVGRGHHRRDVPRCAAGHTRLTALAHPARLADVPGTVGARPRHVRGRPGAQASPRAGTSSPERSSTAAGGRADTSRSRGTSPGRRGASGRTSSTRTSSSRQACSPTLAGRAPVVLTAHGQDVANAERSTVVRGRPGSPSGGLRR